MSTPLRIRLLQAVERARRRAVPIAERDESAAAGLSLLARLDDVQRGLEHEASKTGERTDGGRLEPD